MAEVLNWFLGIAATVIGGTIIYMGKLFSDLPKEYMPRKQIDQKFEDLERRIHNDMGDQDRRNEKQFDRLYNKLDEMHSELKSKADK
jgi:chaperonin cofactor prefoldin